MAKKVKTVSEQITAERKYIRSEIVNWKTHRQTGCRDKEEK